MKFEVRALLGDTVHTQLIEAISEGDAIRILATQGFSVLAIRVAGAGAGVLSQRRAKFDLVLFSIELMELLDAGLGVVEAVEALAARQREGDTTRVFAVLLERLRVGNAFSAALAESPELFPPIYIGLIRAAERTSDLKGAFERYLEYRGRFDALRSRVVSAMIYPVILLGVGLAVTFFLMGWVMPKFSTVFAASGHALPLVTRLLVAWGKFVTHNRLELVLAVITSFTGVAMFVVRTVRAGNVELFLRPFSGLHERMRTFRIARLYLTLGTLLNGGMPALQALELASGVLPRIQAPRLKLVEADLRHGESITVAFERHGLTTPVALRLLQAGEGAGRLGEMLVRAARYHDNEIGRWLERSIKLFEPILMVAVGGIVGTIVVMLYMPIFQLAESIR